RERAYSAIGSQLAYQNPDLAIEYIDQLAGQPRHDLINTIASSYAQKDVGEAVTWITQFEGEPLYAGLVGSIAQSVAAEDPRAALQLTESIPASGDKTSAISSIMYTWADTDPAAAADYTERMSDPAVKLAAVESIVGSWAGYDAVATREWVSQLQPNEVRDQGLLTLITNAAHSPADYLSLIGEIRAETMKADALQQAMQNLAFRDREAARSLLEKSGASAAQKEALQCFLDDPNNFGGY
ncbi:MAG: hypothetical protein H0W33_14470, partial [Gammaproteobacteria bacterium]|nr:hypothetical protein [Gammaproteobacteria bacterium]